MFTTINVEHEVIQSVEWGGKCLVCVCSTHEGYHFILMSVEYAINVCMCRTATIMQCCSYKNTEVIAFLL